MTDELDEILSKQDWGYEYQMSDYATSKAAELEYEREGKAKIAELKQAIQALIADQMAEYQAQLLKDYKEDIATAVREARIDERSQAQQYLHGLTITPESQHLFDVLSRNNYDRIKEIKRSKE